VLRSRGGNEVCSLPGPPWEQRGLRFPTRFVDGSNSPNLRSQFFRRCERAPGRARRGWLLRCLPVLTFQRSLPSPTHPHHICGQTFRCLLMRTNEQGRKAIAWFHLAAFGLDLIRLASSVGISFMSRPAGQGKSVLLLTALKKNPLMSKLLLSLAIVLVGSLIFFSKSFDAAGQWFPSSGPQQSQERRSFDHSGFFVQRVRTGTDPWPRLLH